jgi:hypothetical protein
MDIFDKENMAMSEDELLGVSGGVTARSRAGNGGVKSNIMRIACIDCGQPFYADLNKSECKCPMCGFINKFHG